MFKNKKSIKLFAFNIVMLSAMFVVFALSVKNNLIYADDNDYGSTQFASKVIYFTRKQFYEKNKKIDGGVVGNYFGYVNSLKDEKAEYNVIPNFLNDHPLVLVKENADSEIYGHINSGNQNQKPELDKKGSYLYIIYSNYNYATNFYTVKNGTVYIYAFNQWADADELIQPVMKASVKTINNYSNSDSKYVNDLSSKIKYFDATNMNIVDVANQIPKMNNSDRIVFRDMNDSNNSKLDISNSDKNTNNSSNDNNYLLQ